MLKPVLRMLFVALAVAVLAISFDPSSSRANEVSGLGGKFSSPGSTTVSCNGVTVSSNTQVEASVSALVVPDGFTQVVVFTSISGSGTDMNHNTYTVEGSATALYNALAGDEYVLPMVFKVKETNGTTRFSVYFDAAVDIDGLNTQKPTNVFTTQSACVIN
jgi:hypothetical protein